MTVWLVRHAAPAGIAGQWSLYDREPVTLAIGDRLYCVDEDDLEAVLVMAPRSIVMATVQRTTTERGPIDGPEVVRGDARR